MGYEGRKERDRNTNVWLPLTCPYWGPGPQPRHMPWLEIELVTLWFAGWCSIHWATPTRTMYLFFRERGREGEQEGEKHQCVRDSSTSCLSHTPNCGPGPPLRHVPQLGIEPATFQLGGLHLIQWATPASTIVFFLNLFTYWFERERNIDLFFHLFIVFIG